MISYFKSNIRSLWKNRNHTLINIVGLSLGISSALIIFLVVRFELSFDDYHTNRDRIYRLVTERLVNGEVIYDVGVTYPQPEAMRADFPELELVAMTDSNMGDPVIGVTRDDGTVDRFKETQVTFTDPDYFQMFDYTWIEGSKADALVKEKTVVLTKSIAQKYFGKTSAVGKVINFNSEFDLVVTHVVDDPPQNSDQPFRIIITNRLGADKRGWEDWASVSSSINCYVLLREGASIDELHEKMKGWHHKYFTGEDKKYGETRFFSFQPLSELHFDARYTNYNKRVMSEKTIYSLSLIGILLLVTACINFVNLNTVLIVNRSKEVGIKKVLGGSRAHLISNFLAETFMVAVIALGISMGLVELALFELNTLAGYQLDFKPFGDWVNIVVMVTIPIAVSLLAGLYPALSLASFQPIQALKNKMSSGLNEGISLRRVLIGLQLGISQALVICTIIVVQQMDFFLSKPLGLNSTSVVEFEIPENRNADLGMLKERLLQIEGVQSVNMSNTGSTSGSSWGGDFVATVNGNLVTNNCRVKFADEDYVKTYGLELLVGEDLIKSDTANRFLVNETFVKMLGLDDPSDAIGVPVDFWNRKALISGVVKNYHTESLHEEIPPVIIMIGKRGYYMGAAKIETKSVKEVVAKIQSTWEQTFPTYVFDHAFLDDTIKDFYVEERKTSNLLALFSGIAILIGCIGLFGLVSFMVTKRTKEVGIRKTLGASVSNIITLFSNEFLVLIFVSFLIASPVSYYFMGLWLDSFAFRIELGPLTFLLGVGLTLIIVLSTVGYKSFKAAIANPVNALRDE